MIEPILVNFLLPAVERRNTIRELLSAGLRAADPYLAVRKTIRREENRLLIPGSEYDLNRTGKVKLVGVGKAAAAMGSAVWDVLGERLEGGVLIDKHDGKVAGVDVLVGSHPVPDEKSIYSTKRMLAELEDLNRDDLVIAVISGGGSALAADPAEGIELEDYQVVTSLLLQSGAAIDEINIVRKHIDRIKGGGLAKRAAPAQVLSLVLSDVIGNPMDGIASGMLSADRSTFGDALTVLERYNLRIATPKRVLDFLERGASGGHAETVKAGDPILEKVKTLIVADNQCALKAVGERGKEMGYQTEILTLRLSGEAKEQGRRLGEILLEMRAACQQDGIPRLGIAGGETTVRVFGSGRGGRNQELALGAVEVLAGVQYAVLATLATDGEDGSSDAAGAIVTGDTYQMGVTAGMTPEAYLQQNDSDGYFRAINQQIFTGPTGTNVNDLVLLMAW